MCAYLIHEHGVHVQRLFSVGIQDSVLLETIARLKICKTFGGNNSHSLWNNKRYAPSSQKYYTHILPNKILPRILGQSHACRWLLSWTPFDPQDEDMNDLRSYAAYPQSPRDMIWTFNQDFLSICHSRLWSAEDADMGMEL